MAKLRKEIHGYIETTYVDLDHSKDEMFIAIGQQGVHSFVFAGVVDEDGKPIVLAKAGKTVDSNPDCTEFSKALCAMAFTSYPGSIKTESLNHMNGCISYSAYSINYQQYEQLLEFIRKSGNAKSSSCFQADNLPHQGSTLTLERQKFEYSKASVPDETKEMFLRSKSISARNTCRTSAIDLLDFTTHSSRARFRVSPCFFKSLPLKASFDKTSLSTCDHFFVLPFPPDVYAEVSGSDKAHLAKIYKRMERMLVINTYDEKTIAKFKALKRLYVSLAGENTCDLQTSLQTLQAWKRDNIDTISELRRANRLGRLLDALFTRKSDTLKMVEGMERTMAHDATVKS